MDQDHRRRAPGQGPLHDLPRVDARAVDRAGKELLEARQPVPAVQVEAAEHLVVPVAEFGEQVVAREPRARQRRPRLERLEVVAAGYLERRLERRVAGRPDAAVPAQTAGVGAEQATQRAELGEQGAREFDRVGAAGSAAKPDREQLGVGERLRAEASSFSRGRSAGGQSWIRMGTVSAAAAGPPADNLAETAENGTPPHNRLFSAGAAGGL